jgi:hypothetical protein
MARTKKPALLAAMLRTHEERHMIEADIRIIRAEHPDASIRTFHREVRADRCTFTVHVVTARAKAPKPAKAEGTDQA